jgi:ABC-type transport system involved in multi-copper enzyme maturation permease subunit
MQPTEVTRGPVTLSPGHVVTVPSAAPPSAVKAWLYLIWLSWQRQARLRQMVWISLALLAGCVLLVAAQTATRGWGMQHWRSWRRWGPITYGDVLGQTQAATAVAAPLGAPPVAAVQDAVFASFRVLLDRTDFIVLSTWMVFFVFVSFLLPLWSLSFGTEALGGDRESHSLLWLLTRPLPRPAIYLAKFVALLPWTLALNLGGFALLCLAAGRPGPQALRLYWPAVLCATLAFAALFHLIGAVFRRPAIIALVYSFFLETIMGNMPGYLKRVSVSFYTRCMMYEAAQDYGVQPEKPSVYLPVDGTTARWVLLGVTVALVLLGMFLFNRKEYVAVE